MVVRFGQATARAVARSPGRPVGAVECSPRRGRKAWGMQSIMQKPVGGDRMVYRTEGSVRGSVAPTGAERYAPSIPQARAWGYTLPPLWASGATKVTSES